MSSSAARKLEYGGNIAYDLSRFDRRKRVRDALENEPVAVPRPIAKPGERAKAAVKAEVRARPAVSAVTVLGFAIAAVLMFCIVLNYMRLNELTIEVSSLQTELMELKSQAATLKVKNEQTLNSKRLEQMAEEMGMMRPTREQICYIDLSHQDRGVVYIAPEEESDFLRGIKTLFFAAIDFFQ
jgi:negative regulator of sigma E activity